MDTNGSITRLTLLRFARCRADLELSGGPGRAGELDFPGGEAVIGGDEEGGGLVEGGGGEAGEGGAVVEGVEECAVGSDEVDGAVGAGEPQLSGVLEKEMAPSDGVDRFSVDTSGQRIVPAFFELVVHPDGEGLEFGTG